MKEGLMGIAAVLLGLITLIVSVALPDPSPPPDSRAEARAYQAACQAVRAHTRVEGEFALRHIEQLPGGAFHVTGTLAGRPWETTLLNEEWRWHIHHLVVDQTMFRCGR